MSDPKKFYGKYRGTVVKNADPEQRGRITVMVPDVSGVRESGWAMPCVPVGGMQTGMFAVPPIGAGVWVEFEQGDPDYPIWTGCFWGSKAEVPVLAQTAQPPVSGIALQTVQQNGIVVSDAPGPSGGITLRSTTGVSIIVNDTGIYIQNGKGASITLTGPTVDINQGAFTVI